MSSEQTPLSSFAGQADPTPTEDTPGPERPAWTPERDDMCQGCGSFVTPQYKKVFSDNQGVLHACVHCETNGEMYSGAGAGL